MKQWEIVAKSKIASSTPLPLSCYSPIGGLFDGLTNGKMGGGRGGVVAYPGRTTIIANRFEYTPVAFKVKSPFDIGYNERINISSFCPFKLQTSFDELTS